MAVNKQPFYIIGCIPLRDRLTPPPEQQNCVAANCTECGCLMWLSEKKRKLMKDTNKDFWLLCFPCCAALQHAMESEDTYFEEDQVDNILAKERKRGKR